jgi:hypothetical protein
VTSSTDPRPQPHQLWFLGSPRDADYPWTALQVQNLVGKHTILRLGTRFGSTTYVVQIDDARATEAGVEVLVTLPDVLTPVNREDLERGVRSGQVRLDWLFG